jgi:hypothetical protein
MLPTLALYQRPFILLADDTVTWENGGDPLQIWLVQNNVNYDKATVVGDLTAANFSTYAPVDIDPTTVEQGLDPLNNDSIIDVRAGGTPWRWEVTSTSNLPQTIFGFALVNTAGTLYFAGESFATPIVLNAVGQQISVTLAQLRMAAGAMT